MVDVLGDRVKVAAFVRRYRVPLAASFGCLWVSGIGFLPSWLRTASDAAFTLIVGALVVVFLRQLGRAHGLGPVLSVLWRFAVLVAMVVPPLKGLHWLFWDQWNRPGLGTAVQYAVAVPTLAATTWLCFIRRRPFGWPATAG